MRFPAFQLVFTMSRCILPRFSKCGGPCLDALPSPKPSIAFFVLFFASHKNPYSSIFNATVEGTVIYNIDPYAMSGGPDAASQAKAFVSVTDGTLTIVFTAVYDAAKIMAIEVHAAPGYPLTAPYTPPSKAPTKSPTKAPVSPP
jgi:hypothetical protein